MMPSSAEGNTNRAQDRASSATVRSSPGHPEHSINLIAQDMKILVKKIQDLRHLGIEENTGTSKIALPKICVVGDQSTGKSSLIEGMSEIKVPRSAGTCTRCPMEINLSHSEPGQSWTCRVFLSRKYIFDASQKMRVTKRTQPLGPWVEQEPDDELFVTLTDKSHVQEALKWAQLAILNPGRPSADYIPGQNNSTDSQHYQVKFSPNVVRLDISAPDFPNLSFYDLPGVISQAEIDEERYLVSLVENLVREYVSQENCIVLLALPMTDDATNSSAARLIRDVKGATPRTLGVLTKPDRIQLGEYAQWLEILEGDKFSLGHGYFIVRNNKNPSIEHAIAREEEAAFFALSPWSTELAAYQDRFGTRRLQAALSNLLLEQIQGCLPRIIEQINKKANHIDSELRTLPDPPSANVPFILCRKLNHLKDQIRAHIDGGSSQHPTQKIWGHIAMDFKRALVKTRPTVQLLAPVDSTVLAINREDDDSDCEITSIPVPVKRNASGDPVTQEAPARRSTGYATPHFEMFDRPARMFTWEEVKEINEDSCRAGLPDQTDPKAIEIMNQLSVDHWHKPMEMFLGTTYALVRKILMEELDHVFSQYHQTSLFRELHRIIDAYLQTLKREHVQHAKENYTIERNKPFTMSVATLEQARTNAYQYLCARRHHARANNYLNVQGRLPEDDPRRENEIKKLTNAELGPEMFTQEIRMMASARGYHEVASARFVDSICQSVHTKLFSKCREDLITIIEKELGILDDNAVDRCMELMAEHPDRQRRRQYLLREKEKASKAQEWLATARKDDDTFRNGDGFQTNELFVDAYIKSEDR